MNQETQDPKARLLAAARHLFGRRGYADTSLETVASVARVPMEALYRSFPTKKHLFEAVFQELHMELVTASVEAAARVREPLEMFVAAFDAYLDALLEPGVQRIAMIDGAEVLGFARFNELDERFTLGALAGTIRAVTADGLVHVKDPDNVARLLLGAVARGGMHIASSKDPIKARDEVGAALVELATGIIPAPRARA